MSYTGLMKVHCYCSGGGVSVCGTFRGGTPEKPATVAKFKKDIFQLPKEPYADL